MKISFDFDSCLSTDRIQRLAKLFISKGHDVWITTSRFPSSPEVLAKWPWIEKQNEHMFAIATECGIPHDKIQFTAMTDKWKVLTDFDIHYDDDDVEINLIDEYLPTCIGVLILTPYKHEQTNQTGNR